MKDNTTYNLRHVVWLLDFEVVHQVLICLPFIIHMVDIPERQVFDGICTYVRMVVFILLMVVLLESLSDEQLLNIVGQWRVKRQFPNL